MKDALVERLEQLGRSLGLPPELVEPRRTRESLRIELAEAERLVAAKPESAFAFDPAGFATLSVGAQPRAAGRFSVPTLAELRARLPRGSGGRVRVHALEKTAAATDIGALQAFAPPGTVFQVASQFNCLEAPGPRVVAVQQYISDPTQGPRASVSAWPGTLLRHYHAPADDGSRFAQTDERGIELLGLAIDAKLGRARSGYLRMQDIPDLARFVATLEERFEQVRVGLHEDVEVCAGHDWTGPVPTAPAQRVSQVFTSTLALGGYSSGDSHKALEACRLLLRASYTGTLFAAAASGAKRVVLTFIGGGVFGNPTEEIEGAIVAAVEDLSRASSAELEVLVNTRSEASLALARLVKSSDGSILRLRYR
ncbi:MAG: hypothetical protein NTV21_19175 [Planctomycetota bacterium]|nr:hypothetical protein [Planctomycetota bacterium]